MTGPEFSIPARDLDAGGKHVCFAVRASWLRGALEATDVQPTGADGELDLRVSKSGTDVVVRGTVTAQLSVACSRCLQPARVVVREPLSALVVLFGTPLGDTRTTGGSVLIGDRSRADNATGRDWTRLRRVRDQSGKTEHHIPSGVWFPESGVSATNPER